VLNAHEMSHRRRALQEAERRLFDRFGIAVESRDVRLADPPLRVRVLESGTGPPLILIHGSGMTAATWAPLMPHLSGRRLLALDLPGFGLSDPYDYSGRPLRSHAVAQLRSLLDALELEQADIVGTSLGGMWALNLAAAHPRRVRAVVSIGAPAVALPGTRRDPMFTMITTPGIGGLAVRLRPPTTGSARRGLVRALGKAAVARTPDEWFEVTRLSMGVPGWSRAMRSHMCLALRVGRPRPENPSVTRSCGGWRRRCSSSGVTATGTAGLRWGVARPSSCPARGSRWCPGTTPPSSTTPSGARR